jgi:hypothetical protein
MSHATLEFQDEPPGKDLDGDEVDLMPMPWRRVAVEQVQKDEAVNHPDHYNQGEIECIDAIRSALGHEGFVAFCRGCIIKYGWRATDKGDEGAEDMRKAEWYAARAAAEIAKGTS